MSLTSLLKVASSPLRGFLAKELPTTGRLRTAFRQALPASLDVIAPSVPEGTKPPWSTLGTAADHRLRLALTAQAARPAAVMAGIELAGRTNVTTPQTASALETCGLQLLEHLQDLAHLHQLEERARPLARTLDVERDIARACHTAALFESVYRRPDPHNSPLLRQAHPELTLDALFAGVPAYAVDDLATLTARADTALATLRAQTPPHAVTLAPTFTGSEDVGGADGDWLADGTLIDVKTTIHPDELPLADIYQLTGYLLLDYQDTLNITHVGWYSARAGALVTFTTPDFLDLLGARHPLPVLRDRLARLLGHTPSTEQAQPDTADTSPHPVPPPSPSVPRQQPSALDADPQPPADVFDDPHHLRRTEPAPTASPPRRVESVHGDHHYQLSLTPGPQGQSHISVLVLAPHGEIISSIEGSLAPADLQPVSDLLRAATQLDPVQPAPPATPSAAGGNAAARNGQSWTAEDLDRLAAHHAAGTDPAQMARQLGRTERSVRFKLHQLGLARFPGEVVRLPASRLPTTEPAYSVQEIRRTHPRAYQRWTPEEDARLADLHRQGAPLAALVEEFGRNEGAINARLGVLGP
ncbi:hypothetical protein OG453_44120 [Streptomyces sp. NBC_01381]|uniref:hypothetical protein n=1 Tax=Streptomyces sp. NBC_01381 TaxID=2903845 RepID=UPI00225AF4F3|nr:hypothetical protein [Streptomyces sp. NBC_01381]MCX4673546.1 hypothetical protein [Streptomyces sp. NBC_01381]